MAFNISYIYKAVDNFSSPLRRIKRNVQKLGIQLTGSAEAARKLGDKLSSIGKKAAIVATVGIALGVRHLARYETALLGVAKTANIDVGKSLDAMGSKFRKLSLQIPIGVVDLLNFGQSAAQMGVIGEENILNFAETMAKLTKTTNIMGEEGTSQLARLINVTQGNIAEVENYASTLVALGNTSAATEAEILEFATQLSGAGALFGITGTQAMGLATAMRTLGIQSEVGSSVLGRSLGVVNKAIRTGGREMQFISKMTQIAGKDLKDAFNKDAVDVVAKLGAGLERLESTGGDVVGALGFLGLEGIRDIRVLGSLAKNTDLVTQKMELAKKAFKENTALEKEFAIQSQSLSNKWVLFKNVIGETALIIGNALMPILKGTLTVMTSMVSGINSALKGFGSFISLLASNPILNPIGVIKNTLFNNEPSKNINTNNNVNATLNGSIDINAPSGVIKGASSKVSGMKGNLGMNMAGAM